MSRLIRETSPTPGFKPAILPQHEKADGSYVVSGENNPLPVGNYVQNDSGLWVPVSQSNPMPTQLTGSRVSESQAIPIAKVQKDIVAKARDNILDTIGLDNIIMWMPLSETSGSIAKDLINPEYIKFNIDGATLGQLTPFGYGMSFDGANDIIVEEPVIGYRTAISESYVAMDSSSKKVSQLLEVKPTLIRSVAFKLRKVGSPVGRLVAKLYKDDGSLSGDILVATSDELDVNNILPTAAWKFFWFSDSPGFGGIITYGSAQRYKLELEWASTTTIDASNYIEVYLDTDSTYGNPWGLYDGVSQNINNGQSLLFFCLWGGMNRLIDSDVSVIAVIKSNWPYDAPRMGQIISIGSGPETGSPTMGGFSVLEAYNFGFAINENRQDYGSLASIMYSHHKPVSFSVVTLTLSYESSNNKAILYVNGVPLATSNGTNNLGFSRMARPFCMGSGMYLHNLSYGYRWAGIISNVIITTSCLTQAQVTTVTKELFALRKHDVEV